MKIMKRLLLLLLPILAAQLCTAQATTKPMSRAWPADKPFAPADLDPATTIQILP